MVGGAWVPVYVVVPCPVLAHVLATHNRHSGRHTNRAVGNASAKRHTFAGESIQIGCFDDGIAGVADHITALLIREDENDVGLLGYLFSSWSFEVNE